MGTDPDSVKRTIVAVHTMMTALFYGTLDTFIYIFHTDSPFHRFSGKNSMSQESVRYTNGTHFLSGEYQRQHFLRCMHIGCLRTKRQHFFL